ncbi:hypothetical protein, partial [Pseudomonas syringae group genomosp. 7]|uniref:hypothetical protein n=1 Tax=Pseudomonas syringae group genomosp. 7 TaxID=251699 RepID=UPI00376F7705
VLLVVALVLLVLFVVCFVVVGWGGGGVGGWCWVGFCAVWWFAVGVVDWVGWVSATHLCGRRDVGCRHLVLAVSSGAFADGRGI